ncbi:MAG: hypothetical protein KDD40_10060 [Bdellovibrionales bacterium]|nr:hypothetical protein [Bdellovibrionales bacterium]
MKTGNLLNIVLILLSTIFIACGSAKTSHDSGEFSSRDIPNSDGTSQDENSAVEYYALCNGFTNVNLNGSVTAYLNPVTNLYEWDLIRMEIKDFPPQLKDKDTFYIQFFRWQEDTPNQPYTNSAPVGVYFQYQDGTWLNNTPITSLSKNVIEELIANNNLQNVTLNNFLSKVVLVLSGMDLEYDAVMINTYDSAAGSDALTSTNVLLPAFEADPNLYALTHPATHLQELHPNWDLRDSGYTQWQYFQETQNLCGF